MSKPKFCRLCGRTNKGISHRRFWGQLKTEEVKKNPDKYLLKKLCKNCVQDLHDKNTLLGSCVFCDSLVHFDKNIICDMVEKSFRASSGGNLTSQDQQFIDELKKSHILTLFGCIAEDCIRSYNFNVLPRPLLHEIAQAIRENKHIYPYADKIKLWKHQMIEQGQKLPIMVE